MTNSHPRGSKWESFTRLVFATYGDVCIVCGHGGARTVDHLESLTEHPELAWVLSNCRPIHALPYNRCRQCRGNGGCNGIKGGYSLERARRRVAEINGKPLPPPEPPKDTGRVW
jgi:hypothetical protein